MCFSKGKQKFQEEILVIFVVAMVTWSLVAILAGMVENKELGIV